MSDIIELKFIESYDQSECDDCGYNQDNGLVVYVDEELVVDSPAIASCFGGHDINISYNGYKTFADIIEHITGRTVVMSIEGEGYRY